jgi:tetraacyldisaccharide-1-P 4'-kinase
MYCEVSVNVVVSKKAHEFLQLLASQNQKVNILIEDDGSITLSALMLDFNELPEDWNGIE